MRRDRRRQRGVALILTLVAITLMALLAAAIGNLVVGHLHRADTDQDATKALNLAEAALNFQVQKISANINGIQVPFDGANFDAATHGTPAKPLSLNALSVNVGSTPTPLRPFLSLGPADTCRAWVNRPLNVFTTTNIFVYGEATAGRVVRPDGAVEIEGVTRRVRARGSVVGVFDNWVGFAINEMTLNGSGIRINGTIGTNNRIQSNGNVQVAGISLHGRTTHSEIQRPTPVLRSNPIQWPTLTEIANQHAAYCRDYDMDLTRPAYQNSATFTTDAGIDNFDGTDNDNSLAICRDASGAPIPFPHDGSLPSGATVTLVGMPYSANYYLTGLRCGGGNGSLTVDATQGPVNLWIDSAGNDQIDEIRDSISLIRGNPERFRIYYRNAGQNGRLRLNGGGTASLFVPAMIYAFDQDGSAAFGSVEVRGRTALQGSVIADRLDFVGNDITVDAVANAGAWAGEGLLYFGLTSPWLEDAPLRGN